MIDINIITPDTSSAFFKYEFLKANGYLTRSNWERAGIIDVLPSNYDYYDLLTKSKMPFAFDRKTSTFGREVEATFFADNKGYFLYSTVLSHKKPSQPGEVSSYIDSTKKFGTFASASIFLNKAISSETNKNDVKVESLPSVQLFRYEPIGNGYHINSQNVYSIYPNFTKQEAKLYEHYFDHVVSFPHFHFPNHSMATAYGKTNDSDAISLKSLAGYIKDLIEQPKEISETLLGNTFGLPYLSLLHNPNAYSTTINLRNMVETTTQLFYNKQLKDFLKSSPEEVTLTGLPAVYADLTLLQLMRNLDEKNEPSISELSLACKVASAGLLHPRLEQETPTFDIKEVEEFAKRNLHLKSGKGKKIKFDRSEEDFSEVDEDVLSADNIVYGSQNPCNAATIREKTSDTEEMVLSLITLPLEETKTNSYFDVKNITPTIGGLSCEQTN